MMGQTHKTYVSEGPDVRSRWSKIHTTIQESVLDHTVKPYIVERQSHQHIGRSDTTPLPPPPHTHTPPKLANAALQRCNAACSYCTHTLRLDDTPHVHRSVSAHRAPRHTLTAYPLRARRRLLALGLARPLILAPPQSTPRPPS